MILNIIVFITQGIYSIVFGIILAIWTSIVGANNNCRRSYSSRQENECSCKTDSGVVYTFENVDNCDNLSSFVSTATAIIAFLVIAAIISLAGSIMGCIAVCCNQVKSSLFFKEASFEMG